MNTIETLDSVPFKHLIMTIGELPTSYVESMTYYEMLAWLCNYVQTKVIPAVNTNAEALKEIQEWISSLDLQDEVDNKLDEMAEDGTLAEIIAQYLQVAAILAFSTVASMKSAENLIDGSLVETYGFYSVNDEGGAKYKVRTVLNSDVVDEITLIALHDNTLVAELIKGESMNVKQFGAKGDSETDDTTKIQKALNYVDNITIPNGTYMINAVTSIKPNSNNTITFSENATLKAITNNADTYAVIKIDNKDNVSISGGTIQGDRTSHTGETGEWGHCISIVNGSSNILLNNIKLKDAWGDGLYVNDVTNLRTENINVDNTRRNGYSLIKVTNFLSNNDHIQNISGTAPQCGVDIEPNQTTDTLDNIVFNNLTVKNTVGHAGFLIYLENTNNSDFYTVQLNNYNSINNYRGIEIDQYNSSLKGKFIINQPTITDSTRNGILCWTVYSPNSDIIINEPYISNYNAEENNNVEYSGILVKPRSDSANTGNVTVKNGTFVKSGNQAQIRDFAVLVASGYSSKGIKFIDPYLMSDYQYRKGIRVDKADDLFISDKYQAMLLDADGSQTIDNTHLHGTINTSTYTGGHNISLKSTCPIGYTVRITRDIPTATGASIFPTVKFDSGDVCYPLVGYGGANIKLSGQAGTAATFKHVASGKWYIMDQNGTIVD